MGVAAGPSASPPYRDSRNPVLDSGAARVGGGRIGHCRRGAAVWHQEPMAGQANSLTQPSHHSPPIRPPNCWADRTIVVVSPIMGQPLGLALACHKGPVYSTLLRLPSSGVVNTLPSLASRAPMDILSNGGFSWLSSAGAEATGQPQASVLSIFLRGGLQSTAVRGSGRRVLPRSVRPGGDR